MSHAHERRVLLVDDSAAARAILEDLIEPYGFEVEHAEHGARALHALAGRRFDAVFLDVQMPVLDGPSLLRVMRQRGDTTPVVVVSGVDDTRFIASAVKLGASDFLAKPFEPGPVRAVLAKVLGVDVGALKSETPRALLVGAEPASAAAFRAAVPRHVEVDEVGLGEAPAAAEGRAYRLFLVDLPKEPEAAVQAGARLRARQPEAACVALVEPGEAWRFRAEFPFDAAVSKPPSAEAVRTVLYPVALRPLVVCERDRVTLLPFRGDPTLEKLCLDVAGRRLRVALQAMADMSPRVTVDLSRAPARAALLEGLVATLAQVAEAHTARIRLLVPAVVRPALVRLGLQVELEGP